MSSKWINGRIISTEEAPLYPADLLLLKAKIRKQFKHFLPAYILLLSIAAFFMLYGPASVNVGKRYKVEISDDMRKNFWIAAPYVSGFIALMATIFFGRYYIQNVQPIIKDVRSAKKKLIFFQPQKTEMALFKRYYLGTPIFSNQQIQVSLADFLMINEGNLLCLEIAPVSQKILRLMYGEKVIQYW